MNRIRIILAVAFAGSFGALSASAQNISVVSGNGQLICTNCPDLRPKIFQPLVVRVTDSAGVALAGVTVNWLADDGRTGQSITASDGTAQTQYFPDPYPLFTRQYSVAASTPSGATVTFHETVGIASIPPGTQILREPAVIYPQNLPVDGLSGSAGSTGAPMRIFVANASGLATPNVAVFVVNRQDPAQGPIVQCLSGTGAGVNTVLSDASGTATCTPVFGGRPGTGRFSLLVGGSTTCDPTPTEAGTPICGYWDSQLLTVTVTPGEPGRVVVTAGANQSANPGVTLATALQVRAESTSGVPLAGQQVRWTVSPAGAGTFGSATTSTDASGLSSTSFSIATTAPAGNLTVTAALVSDPTRTATFTVTVVPLVTITNFTIVSGNNQSTPVGTAFQPLVVQVTTSGSAANVPVQFTASGPVSLSATNVNTDANGRAQVNVTAGNITGAASVTARLTTSSGIGTQTFNLTVLPPAPVITAGSFINGADAQLNSFSPCSLAALIVPAGTFAPQAGPTFLGLPLASTNIQIQLSNVGAPVLNVAPTADGRQQVTFQVPCEVLPGTSVPLTLSAGGATSSVNLNVQAASPGIFHTIMSDGVRRPILIRPDGSFVSLANPARRGENIVALVTGLGATTPSVGTNSVPAPGSTSTPTGTVVVGMSGQGVELISAERSPDLPGVFLVTFQIPGSMATGNDVSFSVAVIPGGSGTPIYSAPTRIPVQ